MAKKEKDVPNPSDKKAKGSSKKTSSSSKTPAQKKALEDWNETRTAACAEMRAELSLAPKRGRPTKFTPEMEEYIIRKVASSKAGLHLLCKHDPNMPNQDTINEWRWLYPKFSERYLLAKQHQTHLMAEFCEEISDDKHTYVDPTGQERVDPGDVAAQRLRVDTRKWYASKLNPQAFGDKKTIDQLKEDNEAMKAELLAIRAQLARKNEKDY